MLRVTLCNSCLNSSPSIMFFLMWLRNVMLTGTLSWLFVGERFALFTAFQKLPTCRLTTGSLFFRYSIIERTLKKLQINHLVLKVMYWRTWRLFFSVQLSADVYRIHSLPSVGPVVLFKGGAVRTLDVLLEAPQQEIETIISDEVIK